MHTDSPDLLARIERCYSDFRTEEALEAPIYQVTLSGRPEAHIEGHIYRSDDPATLAEYAFHAILSAVEARVRSHFLFHAAALANQDGLGVLLAGQAGMGKTTLAQALVERGYGFLSDDVAAIERGEGRLDPFPKRVGVRRPGHFSAEKLLITMGKIAPSCPARFLFVLHDPGAPAGSPVWHLMVDRIEDGLLAALRAIPGVAAVEGVTGGEHPQVRLELLPRAYPAPGQFASVCRRHGVLLFQVLHDRQKPPNFRRSSHLEPLTATEAAWELLKHVRGGADAAAISHAYADSAARLYVALVELATGWTCYRLAVGRLDEMIGLVLAACG